MTAITSRSPRNRRIGRRNARGGGGGGSFTPAAINPYVWLEADSGITESANRISAYASKVSGISYAQATGANQPLYVAADAGYNNKPIVHIDDVARWMAATVSVPYPFSTFEYGQYTSGAYGHSFGGAASVAWNYSGGNHRLYAFDGTTTDFAPSIADAAGTKRSLYRGLAASKTVTLVRNNGTTTTGANAGLPVAITHTISRINNNAAAQVGKLAAYFVFRRELTAPEITNLHAYCVAKYG